MGTRGVEFEPSSLLFTQSGLSSIFCLVVKTVDITVANIFYLGLPVFYLAHSVFSLSIVTLPTIFIIDLL